MATIADVSKAVKKVTGDLLENGWEPWRATHIEKEAYSILFTRTDTEKRQALVSAVRAIAAIQNRVARTGWRHAPLVIVFPISDFRLSVFIPAHAHVRGKHICKIRGIPLRTYAKADRKIAQVLSKNFTDETMHLASTSVHESLAALAWYYATEPDTMARNVEVTVPTPYPDVIRYRSRMFRDYGVTIGEFDGIGVFGNRVRIMEAKAANGGPRRWTYIIRHKIMSYSGAVPRLGRNVRADLVVTSNNIELAEAFAREAKTLTTNVNFLADVYAAWVEDDVRWERV
ncbi:MAG: hypothetical protein GXN93_02520 [Candidatus Diapherotrites archaeon]|nr:hypothetical protein [Candidatus Diapherotrites archaeon]